MVCICKLTIGDTIGEVWKPGSVEYAVREVSHPEQWISNWPLEQISEELYKRTNLCAQSVQTPCGIGYDAWNTRRGRHCSVCYLSLLLTSIRRRIQ